MRLVQLGTREVEFPSTDLQQLTDSNHLLGDVEALRREMKDKGYLYIRGMHARDEVLAARLAVLEYVRDSGDDKLSGDHAWQRGILNHRCGYGCVPFMEGKNDITHSDPVLKVLEGPRPYKFFKSFLGEDVRTFDFKWLRGIYRTAFTGAHVDQVYMGRGTDQLYTMWTPFDDVTIDMGTLAVCEASNNLPSYRHFQDTYGNCDIEKIGLKGTGWFTTDPFEITSQFGGQWKSTDFQAGDVLIFTMRTVHMSTANTTDKLRISCDTRWQPASHTADPRYVGDFNINVKFGLAGSDEEASKKYSININTLKQQWGFPLALS